LENAAPRVHNLEPESGEYEYSQPDIISKSPITAVLVTETLYAFLQSKTLPFNEQELIEEGFNKIEISCAHLSTGNMIIKNY